MRFVMNGLIALMVVGLCAGVMYHQNEMQQQKNRTDQVRDAVRQFQRQVMLQATLRTADLSDAGFPLTIDPAWFEEDRPENDLLPGWHPWVEIAHKDDRKRHHPSIKLATQPDHARFWYNPYNGVVRARIPATTSDAAALELYNYINGSNLTTLFGDDS